MVINMGIPLTPTIKHKAFTLSWFFYGITGDGLKVELRAGNVYTSRNIVSFIGPLLSWYQKEFTSSYRLVHGGWICS